MKGLLRWTPLVLAAAGAFAAIDVELRIPPDAPAINYFKSAADDPIARLARKLDKGEAKLTWSPSRLGYLPSLLKNLDINPDSQMLVFSKTSFQAPLINPRAPRAIFFNDTVSVGSVHNGEVLELAALDPTLGVVFYTLSVDQSAKPAFLRRDVCLQCHQGPATLGVPGLEVGSSFPGPDGSPIFHSGFTAIDHRIPISDRWGGWYVTGNTGKQTHRGNAVVRDPDSPTEFDRTNAMNLASLTGRFSPEGYMSMNSDVVALMVLEHQTRMTNLIIRTGWETRVDPTATDKLNADIDELVAYMLFADEAALTEPVSGSSTFTKTFAERGPRDKQGRSLRDFDLKTRMFRYPCSYMIYSEAFDHLPDWARERVYRKLYDVLTSDNPGDRYKKISAADRTAIREIVRDTKPGLPAYWK